MQIVTNETTALSMRQSIGLLKSGIALIPKQYSRGLDVSFAVQSMVIIIVNEGKLTETQLIQMAGRSNRRQGQEVCTLLFELRLLGLHQSVQQLCSSNESVKQLLGGKNVKTLFDMYKDIPPKNIEKVGQVYGNKKWKRDPAEFLA